MRVKKVRDEDYVQWLLEHEPSTCLQVDQCEWRHPVLRNIMVDAGSRAASVTIHRAMDTEHGLGNVTGEIMLNTLLNHWVTYCGKPDNVRTDPELAFRDQGFRRGLAAKSIRLDIDLGDASWKTGVLGKTLDTIKQSAIRVARRTLESVTIQEIRSNMPAWTLCLKKKRHHHVHRCRHCHPVLAQPRPHCRSQCPTWSHGQESREDRV